MGAMSSPPGPERPSSGPQPSLLPVHPSLAADSTRDVAQEDFLFHLYRGSELLQENRVLEAKEELEFALTMQPLDPKGQDLLGAVYFRVGLYPRAIQIYDGLTAQFPRDVSIKINLALCYLKTGQPEPARRTLEDAVRLNPEHKRAWGYLGLALQKLGHLDQAQIAFERGGHAMMAKRLTERRRPSRAPSDPPRPIDEGVRSVAETAFSELDAGELRFALADGEPAKGSGTPSSSAMRPPNRGVLSRRRCLRLLFGTRRPCIRLGPESFSLGARSRWPARATMGPREAPPWRGRERSRRSLPSSWPRPTER
jgi:Tetratricopeptide repeat